MAKKSAYEIVESLMMTEKCALLKEQNQYAFKVSVRASKGEVASAVEEIYGVEVKSVNLINYKGKPKRAGKSPVQGRKANWKKAVVALAKGAIELS